MSTLTLEQSIKLIEQGENLQAQNLLKGVLDTDPHNLLAWYWYVKAHEYAEERIDALKVCLKHNPENKEVKRALEKLQASVKTSTPAAKPDKSLNTIFFAIVYMITIVLFVFQFKYIIFDIPWSKFHGFEGLIFLFYAMGVVIVWLGFSLISAIVMMMLKKQKLVTTIIVGFGILIGCGCAFVAFMTFHDPQPNWLALIMRIIFWGLFGVPIGAGLATFWIFVLDVLYVARQIIRKRLI